MGKQEEYEDSYKRMKLSTWATLVLPALPPQPPLAPSAQVPVFDYMINSLEANPIALLGPFIACLGSLTGATPTRLLLAAHKPHASELVVGNERILAALQTYSPLTQSPPSILLPKRPETLMWPFPPKIDHVFIWQSQTLPEVFH